MKILSMFAAAINGYITAVQGRENEVLKMMQAEIERDVDAQKADLQTLKSGAGAARSEYAILKDKIGDEAVARDMLIARKLRSTRAQMQQVAAGAKTDEQKRTAAMLIDSTSRNIELVESGIKLNATVLREGLVNQDMMRAQGARQAAAKAEAQANDPLAGLPWKVDKGGKRGQSYLENLAGFARNPAKDYDMLAKLDADKGFVREITAELREIYKTSGTSFSPTARARADFLNSRLMYTFSAMGDGTAVREHEQAEWKGNFPTGATLSPVNVLKMADTADSVAEIAVDRAAANRLRPGMHRYNPVTEQDEYIYFERGPKTQQRAYDKAQRLRGD